MTMLLEDRAMPIAACLERCTDAVRPIDDRTWEFELPADVPLRVTARCEGQWLRLRAPLARATGKRPAPDALGRMLAANAGLPAAAKFTLAGDPPAPCLTAELFLGEEATASGDLAEQIARVCDGFRPAANFVQDRKSADSFAESEQPGLRGESPGEFSAELTALCQEAGWPLNQRAASIVFELDVPGSFYQAVAQPRGVGGLLLGVDLVAEAGLEGDRAPCAHGRHALAVFLLHASHCLRMVRATCRTVEGVAAYSWEVLLDGAAQVRELDHALAALSVACRLTAREVSALAQDDCLARSYLMLRGWCS